MRILALVTEVGGRGGIAQYNRDLLEAWSASSDRLEVLSLVGPRGRWAPPPPARQSEAPFGRVGFAVWSAWLALRSRPDLVFCGHLHMAPMSALLARLVGARLAVQLHGIEVWARLTPLRRWAIEQADLVLCVSRDTRAKVLSQSRLASERAIVLPNTVAQAFSPAGRTKARAQFGLDGRRVLLSVGRLDGRERYKGHDRVIRALATLVEAERTLVYLIAGSGDDQARLAALARDKGVSDLVRFLGDVEVDALPALYRAADLFVLPSTGEGFGIVYLEAMASGTPALGLGVGGAVDALGEGRLGLVAGEAEFGAMLLDLMKQPATETDERAELAQRTRSRFGKDAFASLACSLLTRSPCEGHRWTDGGTSPQVGPAEMVGAG